MMRNYTLRFLPSSRDDLVRMKEYILKEFMYPQYGVNFDAKIKDAIKIIKKSPRSFKSTEFTYRGLEIYMRCINTYLFFYIVEEETISVLRVLKDGMNWQYLIELWIVQNK